MPKSKSQVRDNRPANHPGWSLTGYAKERRSKKT